MINRTLSIGAILVAIGMFANVLMFTGGLKEKVHETSKKVDKIYDLLLDKSLS